MSEQQQSVNIEIDGRTALITINRPEALNALNADTLEDLENAVVDAAEQEVEVIILTGAGKAFVAGADIKAMVELSAAEAADFARSGQAVVDALSAYPGVTIAAVNGFALGGGMEVAMACDLIMASPKAKFGQPEVKLGVIPGFGGTQRLVRRVGIQRAKELILTGRMVDAQEALSMGLVLRIEDDVVAAARALGSEILSKGPLAVQSAKDCIDRSLDLSLADGLAYEAQAFGLLFATRDQSEGMAAFIEKRDPEFGGV